MDEEESPSRCLGLRGVPFLNEDADLIERWALNIGQITMNNQNIDMLENRINKLQKRIEVLENGNERKDITKKI